MIQPKTVRRLAMAIVVAALSASAGSSIAAAQGSSRSVEVSGEFDTLHLKEVNTSSAGVGVNARWNLKSGIAVDGTFAYFPESGQTNTATGYLGQALALTLVGLRPSFTRGAVAVSARARAGVLDFQQVSQPFPCPATFIYPAPLSCQLAAGYASVAFDFGGGVNVALARAGRLRLHADVSDLLVRYDLNALRPDGSTTNGFAGQNLLFNVGLGWRF